MWFCGGGNQANLKMPYFVIHTFPFQSNCKFHTWNEERNQLSRMYLIAELRFGNSRGENDQEWSNRGSFSKTCGFFPPPMYIVFVCDVSLNIISLSLSLVFLRLMNTPVHQFLLFGQLEMLLIE